jgi:protein-disulfide isomerase
VSDAIGDNDPRRQFGLARAGAQPRMGFVLGLPALLTCMFAALLLVLAHFNAVDLPGCGTASDCTQAAASRWGRLPGTDWPLSFVGFAYFQALAAAYVFSVGRLPAALPAVVGLGAVVSALLTAVMLVEGIVCGYCLTIHVLNIAFAVGCAFRQRPTNSPVVNNGSRFPPMAAFVATFLAASALLALVEFQATAAKGEQTRSRLQQALSKASESKPSKEKALAPGRYLLGPASAPVQVVVVSDYQCPSCRVIDAQLAAMCSGREDVAISVRHFPFCTDCNPHVDKTRHPNACRAALAAEAAGQVGGADAFWKMHDWLFERRGEFTDDELHQTVQSLRLDLDAFLEAMQDEKTLDLIRSDADAADAAGLQFTPMVFINGKAIEVGS